KKKVVWLMVPSKYVDDVIAETVGKLTRGDCIIDGGNSFFKDSVFRHHDLAGRGIQFIDCGTSGGVEGARCNASLMVGGDRPIVKKYEHIFQALAITNGYGHVGGPGAGHFVKMVHNGIEYGMMGAIAEGMNVLHEHREGMHLNITEAIKAYEHGSIIESNLISWLSDAYEKKGNLESIAGTVPKGETEMEMEYLVSHNKVRVLSAALTQRKLTRSEPSFTGTLISAIRNEFGGHTVNKKTTKKVEKKK
ncbi:NAD(P)-binding domain-containing protein, partial [Candidatus Pacebacteria bacterium]|nr:NAD(P)-binding domain-containing protein [Candidatus Paceibacterota bacterium]